MMRPISREINKRKFILFKFCGLNTSEPNVSVTSPAKLFGFSPTGPVGKPVASFMYFLAEEVCFCSKEASIYTVVRSYTVCAVENENCECVGKEHVLRVNWRGVFLKADKKTVKLGSVFFWHTDANFFAYRKIFLSCMQSF